MIKRLAARPGVRQFLRFAAAGAVATLVQYAVLIALVEAAGVEEVPAAVGAYICGTITSYLLNRRFTFADTQISFGRAFAKFALVNLIGLGLNTGLFVLLTGAGMHYILAQMIATGLVLIWNYAGARLFVFR
jgi:putative flippase GtrA